MSGYVGFSAIPLRAAAWLGLAAAGAGFLVALWALFTKLTGIYSPRGWASTMAVILLVGGVQLVMLGVIGEYLSRVYDEVRRRPLYIVRSRVGVEHPAAPVADDRVIKFLSCPTVKDAPHHLLNYTRLGKVIGKNE